MKTINNSRMTSSTSIGNESVLCIVSEKPDDYLGEKIILVSESQNLVIDLWDTLTELAEETQQPIKSCIYFFMQHLDADRYKIFPEGSTYQDVANWVTYRVENDVL